MKILAIDLGKTYGWCYMNEDDYESGYDTHNDLVEWGNAFKSLLRHWKPEMVVISQTNNYGFFNATRAALMQAGIAFYICGSKNIPGIELNDLSARKAITGKGVKKKEIQEYFADLKMQSDELDAYVLAKGWQLLNKIN